MGKGQLVNLLLGCAGCRGAFLHPQGPQPSWPSVTPKPAVPSPELTNLISFWCHSAQENWENKVCSLLCCPTTALKTSPKYSYVFNIIVKPFSADPTNPGAAAHHGPGVQDLLTQGRGTATSPLLCLGLWHEEAPSARASVKPCACTVSSKWHFWII